MVWVIGDQIGRMSGASAPDIRPSFFADALQRDGPPPGSGAAAHDGRRGISPNLPEPSVSDSSFASIAGAVADNDQTGGRTFDSPSCLPHSAVGRFLQHPVCIARPFVTEISAGLRKMPGGRRKALWMAARFPPVAGGVGVRPAGYAAGRSGLANRRRAGAEGLAADGLSERIAAFGEGVQRRPALTLASIRC